MTLTEQLKSAMKEAMKAKDKVRLGTIRLALSAIKQLEVDGKKTLNDDEVLAVLTKMVKQRKDSVEQYTQGGRADLAEIEEAEIKVLETFLPAALSEQEVADLIANAVQESGAQGMQDMGKVMNLIRPQVQGRADMAVVSQLVKAKLNA
ncbi:GatB/YqeY domain-containing protein [Catenovulum agarivorans DS-2]|uniref:GatB/YqeY domain-containing protein n=1 Tax=Catenovulum agarivorans DS-2 TaxID=1328313 RepID=W7QT31_9ALTE|nr:GatB/YqeY domain-containing protein [Catenovulum agarivorans]EWH08560.1 GatB/YqeY domain-containing protein [Catenovulum agarivorans DS-2]